MKTYYIQQKIKPLVNQYAVYEANKEGEQGDLIAFVHQKRFALKEKIILYTDESQAEISFQIQARQVMDLAARYDITDQSGKLLGTIGKAFGASLLKSTWNIFKPGAEDKPFLIVRERNATLAIVRRIWELLPYIGEIPFFVKYNFDFTQPDSEKVLARYDKTTTFKDHYRLDVEDEASEELDSRIFVAMGIMLDALQSR